MTNWQISENDKKRFWSKIEKTDICWIWKAALYTGGYGLFTWYSKPIGAHRFSYILHNGSITPNKQLDHLCRNRKCVNPLHLEEVSAKENNLRGYGLPAINARKTVCKNGHDYSEENTYIFPIGWRHCKTCRKEWTTIGNIKRRFKRNLILISTL